MQDVLHHSKRILPERTSCEVPEKGDQIQVRGKGNPQEGNSRESGIGEKSMLEPCAFITKLIATAPSFALMTEC